MDIPIPDIDFRLLEVDSELFALEYHLNLIEQQLRNKEAFERILSQRRVKKLGLSYNDPEWHEEQSELDYIVEFLLPRLFRGPFLISLYAVFESAIKEIASLIKMNKGIEESINDNSKKDFLTRAKKYYNDNMQFDLCSNKLAWERIKMLSMLRNAIAHANGRIEMLKPKDQDNIRKWETQNIGIYSINGFIIIKEGFLRDTLSLVSAFLNDLVERYKQWDDNQNKQKII